MSKVTVLIPVYNVRCYIQECLESVINQTEKDLEIICVDDASTDGSLEILKEYEDKDKRIKILRHEKNMGLCQTRKDGVLKAKGEYIMFLDSDDYLSLDACENLYRAIREKGVDFLQFGTEIIPGELISENMINWVYNFMEPTERRLLGDSLLKACFVEGIYNCNLVNKIWAADCCKRAYLEIVEGNYVSAEDRYATFLLSYYAKSCDGIRDKYYHYRLGVGITGGEQLDLQRFENRCQGALITNNIKDFLYKEKKFDLYKKEYIAFKNDILMDCIACWHDKLKQEDYHKGYKILLNFWGPYEVIGALGSRYFDKQEDIYIRCQQDIERNVFIYHRNFGNKALHNILMNYVRFYLNENNNIYLLTDTDRSISGDIFMGYRVIYIPDTTNANWDNYRKRAKEICMALNKYSVTEVCYLSPTSHISKLDELVIKTMNVKFCMGMDEYLSNRWIKGNRKLFVIIKVIKKSKWCRRIYTFVKNVKREGKSNESSS